MQHDSPERNVHESRNAFGSLVSSYYRAAAINHFHRTSSERININLKFPLLTKAACVLCMGLTVGMIFLLFHPRTQAVQGTLAPLPHPDIDAFAYEANDTVLTVLDDIFPTIKDGQEIQVSYGGHLSTAYIYRTGDKEQSQKALLLRRGPPFDSSYPTRVTVYLKTSLFQILVHGK